MTAGRNLAIVTGGDEEVKPETVQGINVAIAIITEITNIITIPIIIKGQ
jgi:hypothetical protein